MACVLAATWFVALLDGALAPVDLLHGLLDGAINIVSEVIHLLLAVQVSANDVVCLYKGVELSLKVLVLLGQQRGVLLQGLVFGFEVGVSVHQCLIRVVDGLKVGVLASLLYFKRVELGLKGLELGGQLVGAVVLVTVLLELNLLVLDEGSI